AEEGKDCRETILFAIKPMFVKGMQYFHERTQIICRRTHYFCERMQYFCKEMSQYLPNFG
ncbi:hypothetical protein DF186_21825, partial [Enterococcus hirae]